MSIVDYLTIPLAILVVVQAVALRFSADKRNEEEPKEYYEGANA